MNTYHISKDKSYNNSLSYPQLKEMFGWSDQDVLNFVQIDNETVCYKIGEFEIIFFEYQLPIKAEMRLRSLLMRTTAIWTIANATTNEIIYENKTVSSYFNPETV